MSQSTVPVPGELSPAGDFRIVQRTVMRADQELDVTSLYLGGVSSFVGGDTASRQSGGGHDSDDAEGAGETTYEADRGLMGYGRITSEGHALVEANRRLTFGTYFNAFPASYWRRWTTFDSVRLSVRVRGRGVHRRLPLDLQGPRAARQLVAGAERRHADRGLRPAAEAVHRRRLVLVRPGGGRR